MIGQEIIQEFQTVLREDYDKNVSAKDASEILNDLVTYFDLLAKIHHRRLLEKEVI